MSLEYGEIYDLHIAGEDYKAIYLGERAPRTNLKSKYLVLVNKPSIFDKPKCNFSLIRFKDYRFNEGDKMILKRMNYIKPDRKHIGYLEELLQKIKEDD